MVLDLVRGMKGAGGVEVGICLLGRCEGSPLAEYCDDVVEYDGRYNRFGVLMRTAKGVRKVVKRRGVDVVHTHGLDADLIGALGVRGTGAKQICHLHVSPPVGKRESWKAGLRRRLFRFVTKRSRAWFIAVSDAVRESMASYYRLDLERIVTIPNGVDLDEFGRDEGETLGSANGRVVIGTAARLAPMKGLDNLLDAAARVVKGGRDIELRFAGTGSELERLREQSNLLGMQARVQFLGQVSDMPKFYGGLDVFVLPSLSEGMPLVILEAMAKGVPVLATELAGIPEIICDGENGVLVKPGDVSSLAEALGQLCGDVEMRRGIGVRGEARVRGAFGTERVCQEVVGMYERVMAGG